MGNPMRNRIAQTVGTVSCTPRQLPAFTRQSCSIFILLDESIFVKSIRNQI